MEQKDVNVKKGLPIYLLAVMKKYSDPLHYLKQDEIAALIKKDYGLQPERKSVSRSLTLLEDMGYDIARVQGKGAALRKRLYEEDELLTMLDLIYAAPALSNDEAHELMKKVLSEESIYTKEAFVRPFKSGSATTLSRNTHESLKAIMKAILNGKKIAFHYNKWGESGRLVKRRTQEYQAAPYYLFCNYGRYYILGSSRARIVLFRLEFMSDVRGLPDDSPKRKTINGLNDFDPAAFAANDLYYGRKEAIEAVFRLKVKDACEMIYDYFGKKAKIRKKGSEVFATVIDIEEKVYRFALSHGDTVFIISPEPLVNIVKDTAIKTARDYQ